MDRCKALSECQKIINYRFDDEDVLWEALQAAGSNVPFLRGRWLQQGNRVLAQVGDAVLKLVLISGGYERNEAAVIAHNKADAIWQDANLNRTGRNFGLDKCINQNQANRHTGVTVKMMATAVEAIIGAVFQDNNNLDDAARVMATLGLVPVPPNLANL